jgi:hypothetical protein
LIEGSFGQLAVAHRAIGTRRVRNERRRSSMYSRWGSSHRCICSTTSTRGVPRTNACRDSPARCPESISTRARRSASVLVHFQASAHPTAVLALGQRTRGACAGRSAERG